MKTETKIALAGAGIVALAALAKKKENVSGIGNIVRYKIFITPVGTDKRQVYGEYSTYEEAMKARRNMPHTILRSCTVQVWEEETKDTLYVIKLIGAHKVFNRDGYVTFYPKGDFALIEDPEKAMRFPSQEVAEAMVETIYEDYAVMIKNAYPSFQIQKYNTAVNEYKGRLRW